MQYLPTNNNSSLRFKHFFELHVRSISTYDPNLLKMMNASRRFKSGEDETSRHRTSSCQQMKIKIIQKSKIKHPLPPLPCLENRTQYSARFCKMQNVYSASPTICDLCVWSGMWEWRWCHAQWCLVVAERRVEVIERAIEGEVAQVHSFEHTAFTICNSTGTASQPGPAGEYLDWSNLLFSFHFSYYHQSTITSSAFKQKIRYLRNIFEKQSH